MQVRSGRRRATARLWGATASIRTSAPATAHRLDADHHTAGTGPKAPRAGATAIDLAVPAEAARRRPDTPEPSPHASSYQGRRAVARTSVNASTDGPGSGTRRTKSAARTLSASAVVIGIWGTVSRAGAAGGGHGRFGVVRRARENGIERTA